MRDGAWHPRRIRSDGRIMRHGKDGLGVARALYDDCDAWGRLPFDVPAIAGAAWVEPEQVDRILVDFARAGVIHRYAANGQEFVLLDAYDCDAKGGFLRDRPLPRYPEPPEEVWRRARCSPRCQANREGDPKPEFPGWYPAPVPSGALRVNPETPGFPVQHNTTRQGGRGGRLTPTPRPPDAPSWDELGGGVQAWCEASAVARRKAGGVLAAADATLDGAGAYRDHLRHVLGTLLGEFDPATVDAACVAELERPEVRGLTLTGGALLRWLRQACEWARDREASRGLGRRKAAEAPVRFRDLDAEEAAGGLP